MFLIILSANYTRIKISKEVTQYRNAIDLEELELDMGGKDPFGNSRWQLVEGAKAVQKYWRLNPNNTFVIMCNEKYWRMRLNSNDVGVIMMCNVTAVWRVLYRNTDS